MKIRNEIREAKKGEWVAMDIEMFNQNKDKLHRPHGDFACISLCYEGDLDNVYQIYDTKDLRKLFKAIDKAQWVLHNAQYDLRQLMRWVDIKPRTIWDTLLVEQSCYGGYYQNFSLKDQARRYLGHVMSKEIRKEFSDAKTMTNEMKQYAAKDALLTLQIAAVQKEELYETQAFKAYSNIDEKMIWPILDMPGIPVNVDAWTKAITGFQKQVDELQGELGFNVMSQAQVIANLKKNGIHLQDTKATTLEGHINHPMVKKILTVRMYRKAVSTYGMSFLEQHVEADGKIYPSWNITGAETGRMSSSHPNGQNIPQRKLPIFRTFFVASPGNTFIVDDVSQQEPCILGYESQDRTLIKAIMSGEDLHLAVAREIFNDPKMKKDDDRRAIGKTINLGTSYGLSEHGLSTRLGIDVDTANHFLQSYFMRFNGVFSWISAQRNFAYDSGYVKTSSGRRIYINTNDRQWANNAINAPIQGGAADFTKMWKRKIWERCRREKIPYTVCLVVHDELGSDTPKELVKQMNKLRGEAFQETAETLFKGIPFKSEAKQGKSWACKSIKEEADDESEE